MSKSKSNTIEMNIKKFPHLMNVKDGINTLKSLVDHLEKRKKLCKENFSEMSAFEKNEVEILTIETDIKISKAKKNIQERSDYFEKYMKQLVSTWPEVERDYKEFRKKALLMVKDNEFKSKNPLNHKKLQTEINDAKDYITEFSKNYEMKFRHFLHLKEFMKPDPAKTKK